MELYIVRHAIAEDRDDQRWPDDARRPLSRRGRKRFAAVAAALGHIAPRLDRVLSSGFLRARQTAEMLVEIADWPPPQACPALEFGEATDIIGALGTLGASPTVAIVGHEPSLSELVAVLLGGTTAALEVEMKKGAAVALRFDGPIQPATARLGWMITPRLARALQEIRVHHDESP